MILNDIQIIEECKKGMITPYFDTSIKQIEDKKVFSFGLNPFGYDIRLDTKFKVFKTSNVQENYYIDPKNNHEEYFTDFEGDFVFIEPHSFILGKSIERFKVPRDVTGIVYGKSSYARIGIVPNGMPLDGGWEGFYTLQISNLTKYPVKIYANEGIAQVLFFKGSLPNKDYKEKGGKYQNSDDITVGRVS